MKNPNPRCLPATFRNSASPPSSLRATSAWAHYFFSIIHASVVGPRFWHSTLSLTTPPKPFCKQKANEQWVIWEPPAAPGAIAHSFMLRRALSVSIVCLSLGFSLTILTVLSEPPGLDKSLYKDYFAREFQQHSLLQVPVMFLALWSSQNITHRRPCLNQQQ